MLLLWMILTILIFGALAYKRASCLFVSLVGGVYIILATFLSSFSPLSTFLVWGACFFFLILFNFKPLRRRVFSKFLFKAFQKSLPVLSSTEKEALAAGTVGWDGELFSGMPNWDKCLAFPAPKLSHEELDFLNGPVSELCALIDNWDITHNRSGLPEHIWSFLKINGFFGLIIPKKFSGKGFSAYAHSAVLAKISGKSLSVATVVTVPNSLGPAELLLHYGEEEQKNYYLPRLAKGLEIPCFALTGPQAGSDASAMSDYGIICKGKFQGKEILGIRLNWDKRYITLAPVATLLGLAFKLYDPDHLMGGKSYLGITCALIPTHLSGITIGRRHYPLNSAFPNGPTQGEDVFIPINWIIGGIKMAGQGWRMLMECLAVGRGISLPAMSVGGAKIAAFTTGAYARIRNQFRLPIGKFEGVQEALTRIAAYTYIMDATRLFTVGAIDRGEKPAVPAAISKYHITELGRKVINDAMDVHGGKGIYMGPKNYLADTYQETPISITVEGANILTRSMIIFGQGAIRCHPFILKEMLAVQEKDQGLRLFDQAIFGHIGFILSNAVRAFVMGLTNARFVKAPRNSLKRYYQYITQFSAALAFVSDITMIILGGGLKRRERLSARLGDVLSLLYLASAVLKQFADHAESEDERFVVLWACQDLLYTAQKKLREALANFPKPFVGWLLRLWIFPLGRRHVEPSDKLGQQVADLMLLPGSLRELLAKGAYLEPTELNPAGYMEEVLKQVIATQAFEKKVQQAVKDKIIKSLTYEKKIKEALIKQIITEQEAHLLLKADQARRKIIAVDDFQLEEVGGDLDLKERLLHKV